MVAANRFGYNIFVNTYVTAITKKVKTMKIKDLNHDDVKNAILHTSSIKNFEKLLGISHVHRKTIREKFKKIFNIDPIEILHLEDAICNMILKFDLENEMIKCDCCGKWYRNGDRIRENKSHRHFCSDYCAKRFSGDFARTDEKKRILSEKIKSLSKTISCKMCGKEFSVQVSSTQDLCNDCLIEAQRNGSLHKFIKNKNLRVCKVCGSVGNSCRRPDVCSHFRLFPKMIQYFDFDKTSIGTERVYEEFDKVSNSIRDLYYNKKLSSQQIVDLIGYEHDATNFIKFLSKFVKLRSLSDSISNAFANGRCGSCECYNQYKSGFHTTWENKSVFYRSSYELDYCEELDCAKIPYDMESLRIIYFDTVKNKDRVAIPDFFLSNENKIVEVKSAYTFDKQNMIDKYSKYKELGYKFGLLYEHKMYEENEFIDVL